MTVLQPNKNKSSLTKILFIMGLSLLVFVAAEISVYSGTVNLRHEASVTLDKVNLARVANAELKNEYFALMDQKNLDKLAKERGLIKDKSPKWVFVSQL